MSAASFTKLRTGNWGIRVEGRTVAVGDVITVAKKSGETSEVTITRIVWSGDGVQLCAIEDTRSSSRPEPVSVDGERAIVGQHWSGGRETRLCAGGCGRRVAANYAECRSCERESLDAM